MTFIHLHTHSALSLAEGAIKPGDIGGMCRDFGMPAVAITDTGNLFAALQLASLAKEGIQHIVGIQIWVEKPEQVNDKNRRCETPDQLVLLAQNEIGYKNLMKLTSHSYVNGLDYTDKPAVTWEDLKKHSEGLICLTGSTKGSFGRMLVNGQIDAAENILNNLKLMYPDKVYIELQRHGLDDELAIEDLQLDLAYKHNVPIVATNDCYYSHPDMYEAHDTFLCIAEGTYVQDTDRRRVTPEHYFKSSEQMEELFSDLPEAIENTVNIAKRCAFMVPYVDPIFPKFDTKDGRSEEEEFKSNAYEGLEWRLENYVYEKDWDDAKKAEVREKYIKQLEYEVGVIIQMGFPGYFLIVADFIQWSKNNGVPVGPGRGSGAGSVAAWALKITDLDPLRFGLIFERFLNPERVSLPDFDVDFCQSNREKVIEYVRNKYGRDSVGQIITFGKLQARAVIRDVGRVLQMPYGQVDKIAKLIPGNPNKPITLQEALDSEPDLQSARSNDEQVKKLIDTAIQLEGLYRHAGTHAAGVVIGDRPLDELVPLYQDPSSDMPATQFNMKYVESAGLVKFDFLGLRNLTIIKDTIDFIKETEGLELDPLKFPLDDKKTYEMLAKADNTAVFQLESGGMRDLCRKMQVKNFDEIAAIIALYRPGPMENIPLYLENIKNQDKITYLHPLLEPILKDTYGVMIYQEQVLQAARTLAGYSLGSADLLRRAMGKKIKEEMDKQKEIFIKGCVDTNNIDAKLAEEIFDMIAKFASYGFNKAHTYCYAAVAFQTAYLKANYPVEFMAATMTHEMTNTDKLALIKQELPDMGIPLLMPDINKSKPLFSVERLEDGKKTIRYALAGLKGVGEKAMESVVKERDENGAYKDLYDFARRIDSNTINKKQFESLAKAGAFDSINDNRSQVLGSCEILLKYSHAMDEEKNSAQNSLFGDASQSLPAPELPKAYVWDPLEKLRNEFEAVGFYLSAHPLDSMSTQLKRLRVVKSSEVEEALLKSPSSRLRMAGIVVKKQEKISQKGNKFAFLQVSDTGGVYELTMFSDVLSASREILTAGTPILLSADVDKKEEGDIRFLAKSVELLTDAVQKVTRNVEITISKKSSVKEIKKILDSVKIGRMRVTLIVECSADRDVLIELPNHCDFSDESIRSIRQIDGVLDIQEM